ncbi:MAG: hypothetical protein QOE90_2366 [Thermoplasmata archaeon]|jgi:hypothetical protein|nr:hypothetical protein [Thermoplasmata archaeon]
MLRAALLLALLVAPLLAGCTTNGSTLKVNGVAPAGDGNLNLSAGPGLVVTSSAENHTLLIASAPVFQAAVLQACAGACRNLTVGPGAVIADGDLVGLSNLTLVAGSESRDAAIHFYGPNLSAEHVLGWSQVANAFEATGDLLVTGNLTATRYLGTRTPILLPINGQQQLVTFSTAALEGLEVTIYARGSAQLQNGAATVALPTPFQILEAGGNLTVQVTLTSEGPALYVAEKTNDHFTVRATGGAPASNATFDWFVQAPRKGAEGFTV